MPEATVPRHVGYIIDGNRRWAKKHGLPTYEGHLAGYNVLKEIVQTTFDAGVEYISVYGFSNENWKRTETEVNKIMRLMLRSLTSDLNIFIENGIRLVVLGSREGVSDAIVRAIENAEAKTAGNTGGVLALCFNYSGQNEIVDTVKKIVQSKVPISDINADLIARNLYAPEIPDIDIVVRTSGEQRISNFMLWRIAYSELMFIDKLWPDMKKEDVNDIINEYNKRYRRIGK